MTRTFAMELEGFRQGLEAMARENEIALAACGAHEFRSVNPAIRTSSLVCRRCGGVVGPTEAGTRAAA